MRSNNKRPAVDNSTTRRRALSNTSEAWRRVLGHGQAALAFVAVTAALLTVPTASAHAQVAPTYDISPSAGPIGSALHVTGTGCAPRDGIDLTFSVINGPGRSQNFESEADGSFAFDYTVPPARAGEQTADNTYDTSLFCISSGEDVDGPSFTITGPTFNVDPGAAAPGSTVAVSGVGCYHDDAAASDGTFVFADGQPPFDFDSADDSTYTFSFSVVVPDLPPGNYLTQITCLSQALQSPSGIGGVQLSGNAPVTVEMTVPSPPRSVRAVPRSKSVMLSWLPPASNGGAAITDYVIQRSRPATGGWITVNDGVTTTRSFTVTGLTNGTRYRFRVAARNAAGTGAYSSIVSSVPRTVSSPPRSVRAVPRSKSVMLSWLPPASNGGAAITDYVIQRSRPATGGWITVNDGITTTRSFTVTGLTNGTRYRFRVAARNAAGTGAYSSIVSTTPRA